MSWSLSDDEDPATNFQESMANICWWLHPLHERFFHLDDLDFIEYNKNIIDVSKLKFLFTNIGKISLLNPVKSDEASRVDRPVSQSELAFI